MTFSIKPPISFFQGQAPLAALNFSGVNAFCDARCFKPIAVQQTHFQIVTNRAGMRRMS
jgi:hypothetical protein